MTSAVLMSILIELVLAGVSAYLALRVVTRRAGSTAVMALFLLAITFSIVAIASITFIRKTAPG